MVKCDECPAPATMWISATRFESPQCDGCGKHTINELEAKGLPVRVLGVRGAPLRAVAVA